MYGFTPLDSKEEKKEEGTAKCGITPLTPGNAAPVIGPAKAWSFSTLMNFEKCPHRTFLKSVRRVPEPENEFAARGTLIHTMAEDYVGGKHEELPIELEKLAKNFEGLKDQFDQGKVQLEGEWAFDIDWNPVNWRSKEAWARIKADVMVFDSDTSGITIDHKTGKKFGNELKHNQQLQLYAIGAFLMFPELEYIEVELWYIDQGATTNRCYTRDEALLYLPRWTKRGLKMTTETEFLPKPTKANCKYCPYRENGACEWAIDA